MLRQESRELYSRYKLAAHVGCYCDKDNKEDWPHMRVFEIVLCGCLPIVEYRKDNPKWAVQFKTKEEFMEKVKYWLANDEEREKRVELARKDTLKNHTYDNRMKKLIKHLKRWENVHKQQKTN